ncbi:MAG: DUF2231 domain-containing protein [Elusimicrobiota bacterium]
MIEWYHLHPIAVHFPIALLSVGLLAAVVEAARGKPAWLAEAVSWLLWLGTVSALAAVGLGHLAEETAPHVPSAWEILYDHENLAHWTAGLFSVLSLGRLWLRRRKGKAPRWAGGALLLAWMVAAGLLAYTGYLGGKLVFVHGMGVEMSEE